MFNLINLFIVSGCKLFIIVAFLCFLYESIYNCMLLFVCLFIFISVMFLSLSFEASSNTARLFYFIIVPRWKWSNFPDTFCRAGACLSRTFCRVCSNELYAKSVLEVSLISSWDNCGWRSFTKDGIIIVCNYELQNWFSELVVSSCTLQKNITWWSEFRHSRTLKSLTRPISSSNPVITKSRVWLRLWVGSMTCWDIFKDDSIDIKVPTSDLVGTSTCKLKSPSATILFALMLTSERNSSISVKKVLSLKPIYSRGGDLYTTIYCTHLKTSVTIACSKVIVFISFCLIESFKFDLHKIPIPPYKSVWVRGILRNEYSPIMTGSSSHNHVSVTNSMSILFCKTKS